MSKSSGGFTIPNFLRYLRYRIGAEVEYRITRSAAADSLRRQWWWWRHRFPEYLFPSCLPDSDNSQPVAPGALVPAESLRRRLPVWWRLYDNLLLFGHTLPTQEEVAFRKTYCEWMDKRMREGSLEPLPVEAIQREALATHVPMYRYPFLPQRVLRELREGRRFPGRGGVDCDGEPWLWRDVERFRDPAGRLGVRRAQESVLELRPSDDAGDGSGTAARHGAGRTDAGAAADDVRQAKAELSSAAADVREMLRSGFKASTSLQPQVIAFVNGRIQTFSEALAEFSAGYSQGSQEVATGKMDPQKELQHFWHQMVHTLPAVLQERSAPPRKPPEPSHTAEQPSPSTAPSPLKQ